MVAYTPKEVLDLFNKRAWDVLLIRGSLNMDDKGRYVISDGSANLLLDTEPFQSFPVGIDVEVQGQVGYVLYPQSGTILVKVKPKEVKPLNGNDYTVKNAVAELDEAIKQKRHVGLVSYIQSLAKKAQQERRPIRIAVIHGKGAQTQGDFIKALLAEASGYVHLETYETSLMDAELARAVNYVSQTPNDFAIIVRGGGSKEELMRVGGIQSARAIAQSSMPFYLALGHSYDRGLSLLERVVEHTFATPSLAGTEIGRLIRNAAEAVENLGSPPRMVKKEVKEEVREEKLQERSFVENLKEFLSWVIPLAGIGFIIASIVKSC